MIIRNSFGIYLISLPIMLRSLATVFAKQAALTSIGKGLLGIIFNIWFMAELVTLIVQAIIWTLILQRIALSRAYPFMSLVFCLNLFSAWLLFDEKIFPQHIVGMIIIIMGVAITNLSEAV